MKSTQSRKSATSKSRPASKPAKTKAKNKNPNPPLNVPASIGKIVQQRAPVVKSGKNGFTVSHREPMWAVQGTNGANVIQTFAINPGLAASLPWLAAVAQNFESYFFRRLSFEYVSQRGSATDGALAMSMDYDASDGVPTSITNQMQQEDSIQMNIWVHGTLHCRSPNLRKLPQRYVRVGAIPANSDVKMYDVGTLTVGTWGSSTTNTVGMVYANYDVEFLTPALDAPGTGASVWQYLTGNLAGGVQFTTNNGNVTDTVTVANAANTVITILFLRDWRGVITGLFNGTTLTAVAQSGTSTVTNFVAVVNGGTTQLSLSGSVNASAGQTFILTFTNATIGVCEMWLGQGGF